MARLTDSEGRLLGGLHSAPAELFLTDFLPSLKGTESNEQDPVLPNSPPAFGPEETVSGLECGYGSFTYLTYSSGIANPASGVERPLTHARDCVRLIEQPETRHCCPACHGHYCATHAKPNAHDCSAIIVPKPRVA